MAKPAVQTITLAREGAIAVHLDKHVRKVPRREALRRLDALLAMRPAPRIAPDATPF